MSVAVAVSSPVFSPSSKTRVSSLFYSSASEGLCSSFATRFQRSQNGLRISSSSSSSNNRDGTGGAIESTSSSSSGVVLKRRRPAMIAIPVTSLSFGEVVKSEEAEGVVKLNEIEVEREGYSVYCKKGRKEAMEDRYSATLGHQGDSKQAFFGVFDGHGGAKAAEFAANNLEKNIMNEFAKRRRTDEVEAIKCGYMITDSEFSKEDVRGGTCCVTAIIRNGDLLVSNAGDCRAVMSRGGVAEALTSDHRPSREDERNRIESLGGYVDFCHGGWRLQGSLAVSRGIGDQHLKKWVIAEPDTKILRLESDCEFLILASDGLWEKVSNQEAVDIARALCLGNDKTTSLSACKKLAELAVARGSRDDVTVMVIQLKNYI